MRSYANNLVFSAQAGTVGFPGSIKAAHECERRRLSPAAFYRASCKFCVTNK